MNILLAVAVSWPMQITLNMFRYFPGKLTKKKNNTNNSYIARLSCFVQLTSTFF